MSLDRIREVVAVTNALAPDVTVLLGDFNAGHNYVTGAVLPQQWGALVAALKAPLGTYAILGNHDWWHGALPSMKADGAEAVRRALKQAGIAVLENDSVALSKDGQRVWLAGLADQMVVRARPQGALRARRSRRHAGAGHRRRARDPARPRALHLPQGAGPRVADAVRPHPRRPGQPAGAERLVEPPRARHHATSTATSSRMAAT